VPRLYTREYFDLVKRHLNPGGMVSQWVPLYESDPAVVKSEVATFFEAFPVGTIWGNTNNGAGYDTVLVGQMDSAKFDVNEIQARLARPDYAGVQASLYEAGFQSFMDLLSTYAGEARTLQPWLANAEINRDRNLRLQYLAGLGLNLYEGDRIYQQILSYRSFPEDKFAGSEEFTRMMEELLSHPR
jgi:spermidine synthase